MLTLLDGLKQLSALRALAKHSVYLNEQSKKLAFSQQGKELQMLKKEKAPTGQKGLSNTDQNSIAANSEINYNQLASASKGAK